MRHEYVMTTVNCSYRKQITPEVLAYYLTHKDIDGLPYVVVFFSEVLPHIQTRFIKDMNLNRRKIKSLAKWYKRFGYKFKVPKENDMDIELFNAIWFMVWPIFGVILAWWVTKR